MLFELHKGAFQRTGAYYKADNFPGPLSYPGTPDVLYRNNGDGTFTDVTKETGLYEPTGRGMGAVACDIDGDGDVDIYVTNDAMPNNLWINDGKGHFKDVAIETGTAFGEGGQGCLHGTVCGGYGSERDAGQSWFRTWGYSSLMLQKGKGMFLDATSQSGGRPCCAGNTRVGVACFAIRQ